MFQTDYRAVEKNISQRPGSYPGLPQEALLTSEEDFKRIFHSLPHIKIWAELGSGHGLGPLLFAHLFPHKKSIGIEFEDSRYQVSCELQKQHHITNVEFIRGDLLECCLPVADTYFLYFPTGIVLDRILHELGRQQRELRIVAIESHGDLLARLQKENWLKPTMQIPLSSTRHCEVACVFERISTRESDLHDYSFKKKYFLIDDGAEWIGESYGMEWVREDEYQLLTPPRSFKSSHVKNILDLNEIESRFHPALCLRGLGELRIITEKQELKGELRKIFVGPSFKVEISSGEQVEWSQIRQILWENILCFDSSLDYYFYPHVV